MKAFELRGISCSFKSLISGDNIFYDDNKN